MAMQSSAAHVRMPIVELRYKLAFGDQSVVLGFTDLLCLARGWDSGLRFRMLHNGGPARLEFAQPIADRGSRGVRFP